MMFYCFMFLCGGKYMEINNIFIGESDQIR